MIDKELNIPGVERQVTGSALVPIGGKLPNYIEIQTSKLLDVFVVIIPNNQFDRSTYRQKINDWLFRRARPNFYKELNTQIHLAYADQRGGRGSQHWWRLFFDDSLRSKIENTTRATSLAVYSDSSDRQTRQTSENNVKPPKEWGGMYFRSETEIKIAEQLDKKGVLFFANVQGLASKKGSPVSAKGQFNGRLELDFLVFYKGKLITLEVDGEHHQEKGQTRRDYIRDRILLREGIPTARFTASECYTHTEAVINEFLSMF